MASVLTSEQRAAFERDGYILVRGFFDKEEAQLLQTAVDKDPAIRGHFYDRGDAEGMTTKMATWNHPGDSVYGYAARSHKMVDTMEDLLGGEVYHYHSKITAKEPREGGAWEWHQDYGYWYNNGCLQVLKGSHHLGRIDHGLLEGDQVGADLSRVTEAEKHLELVYGEMEPGDVLFFHCNTLHRSDANRSDDRRWTLICCYNAARNDPYLDHHHPRYTPIEKVADDQIKAAGLKFADPADEDAFLSNATAPAKLKEKVGNVFSSKK